MFKHSVFRNASALIFMQLLGYISPFLVYPYLTRVLGVSGFGQYSIALSITAISLIVTDFGFALSGAHWLAINKNRISKINSYISNVLLIKSVLFFICIIGVFFIITYSSQLNYLKQLLLPIVFLLFSQTYQASWLFQGLERMALAVYPFIFSRLVFIITIYIFVNTKSDVSIAVCLQGLTNILSVMIGGYLLSKQGLKFIKPDLVESLNIFKTNISFFISRASVSVYTSASTFILGYTTNVHSAAYYAAAEKLYTAGQSLTSTVSQALYPYLSRTGDKKVFYIAVFAVVFPLILGVLLFTYFSSDIIILIYGPSFSESTQIFDVFLICMIVNFIGVSFGYPAFAIINRVDIANKSVYFGAIVQVFILLCLYYSNSISPLNVVLSVLATETGVMGLRVYFYFLLSKKTTYDK